MISIKTTENHDDPGRQYQPRKFACIRMWAISNH